MKEIISPNKDPIIVSFTASNPLPSKNNLCPGKTLKAELGSGAPKKILGIVLTKLCVIDMLIMKQAIDSTPAIPNNFAEIDKSITATKLTCIPGTKPVKVPAIIPSSVATSISVNILLFFY